MGLLCLQIKKIPDLSLNKYQSLSDTGIEGVLKRHSNFIRQWHGICFECNISMHLLYVFSSNEPLGERLKLYFLLQGEQKELQLIKPLLDYSPLSDFYEFENTMLPNIGFQAGATLMKNERIAEVYNALSSNVKKVHYVPKWEINEEARLYDLFKIMEAIGKSSNSNTSCAYRIDLYPVSMEQETRKEFTPVLKSLKGDNDIQLVKDDQNKNRDEYAKDICKEYEEWLTNIETVPHFRVNIYSFAEDIFHARIILNAAGAEAITEGNFSIASIKPDLDGKYSAISRMGEKADTYCRYAQQASLPSWPTTFTLDEVEPFFRLPALFDGEVIELQKETAPVFVDRGVYIGKDMNGFPVKFPLEDLPRHAFFTGTPGSGKTNTMLHIVTELRKNNIPFLAMEPAKKEYRELLGNPDMQDIYLFSPHLQSHFPLQMNPFEFPKGVRLSEHLNSLLEVFEGSFSLEGPTYKFLSSAIQKAYRDFGWDIEDVNEDGMDLEYPTLQHVYNNLESEIDASSYDGELKGNVRAFLQVRLGGLMERDAGEVFNTPFSTLRPEDWLKRSAIVELEVLGEQAKNFFVLLVCHYILETLRADPKGGFDTKTGQLKPVRHVIFIEEAHNIIAPSTEQSGSDSVDPKISATAYIVKMLAEVRALREAIIIADQLPTALADEVTKNTGLKLVHRLTAQDDREQIGTAISASALQLEQMTTFSKGKALIYHEKTMKPFQVQVAEWIKPTINYDFTNDACLYQMLRNNKNVQNTVATAIDVWKEKYFFPVYEQVVQLEEVCMNAIESQNSLDLAEITIKKSILKAKCKSLVKKCNRLMRLWLIEENEKFYKAFQEIFICIDEMIESLDNLNNYN